jgi:hypothetical protein
VGSKESPGHCARGNRCVLQANFERGNCLSGVAAAHFDGLPAARIVKRTTKGEFFRPPPVMHEFWLCRR